MKTLDSYNALEDMEREDIFNKMTEVQRAYIENELKRGKKTLFANEILNLNLKVNNSENIPLEDNEYEVADWELVRFIDYGRGQALGRCYCKRPVVVECIIRNRETGRELVMGRNHLAMFYGVGLQVFNQYFKKYMSIDFERDEVLVKFRDNAFGSLLRIHRQLADSTIAEKITLPSSLQRHIEVGLPLLSQQEKQLVTLFEKAGLQNPFVFDNTSATPTRDLVEQKVVPFEEQTNAVEIPTHLQEVEELNLGIVDDELREEMARDMLYMSPPTITYVENGSFLDMYKKQAPSSDKLPVSARHHDSVSSDSHSQRLRFEAHWERSKAFLKETQWTHIHQATNQKVENASLADYVIALIQSGLSSLNEICDALAEKLGERVTTGFYQTGKRKLYYDVVVALNPRVEKGEVIESKISVYDVIYRMNENYIAPIEDEDVFPTSLFDFI